MPDCAFATPEGSAARWEALAESILATPLDLGDGTLYTYDFLIGDATGAMYSPETWGGPDGYGAFFDFLADAALGDAAAARAAAAVRAGLLERLGLHKPKPEADYDNGFDAYYGNQCADTEYPRSFGDFRAISDYARAGSRFGPYWWWANAGCASWPVAKDRYTGPWQTQTSQPVLVVGNYFDGVTDFAGAQASANLLTNSRLLAYAGWGHTAYGRSDCVTAHVNAYLLAGTLPPAGTVCPANPNPFVQSIALRRAAPPLIGLPGAWQQRR